jgi:hypothetical protein
VESVEQWRAGRNARLNEEYLKGKPEGKRGERETEEEDGNSEIRSQKSE